jgi:tRNA (guanine37-N1)-methyltransferase
MRFDIITLFPNLFEPLLTTGVTRRAFDSGLVDVRLSDLRDFAAGNYRRVDDRPFGGGPGMVMTIEPLSSCVENIKLQRAEEVPVILFSPTGKKLNHATIARLADSDGAILVCGRYEGIDQRFVDRYVTEQISLGDFVLSGGEIAAMALLDAVARLQPGVLNTAQSHNQDSFNPSLDGLLDCPHYSRPPAWEGRKVPDVLLSGNHAQIKAWRREQSLAITARERPDLIEKARVEGRLSTAEEAFLSSLSKGPPTLTLEGGL